MSSTLHTLSTRGLTTGATVGAAIGAAAAGILLISGLILFAMWYRKRHAHHCTLPNDDPTAEKDSAPGVKRCHSCARPQNHKKPSPAVLKDADDNWDDEANEPRGVARPWLRGNGSRASFTPSFSSKRATRMMMVM